MMALAGVLAFRKRQSLPIGPKPRLSVADALAADDLLDEERSKAEEKGAEGENPLYTGGGGESPGAKVSVSVCSYAHA